MKCSFVFVLAALVLQCTGRPQGVPVPAIPTGLAEVVPSSSTMAPPSSPAAETILTDVASPTEVSTAGDQVVFDESASSASSQDDADATDAAGVTTDMPARSAEEMQMDDAATTMTPEVVMEEIAQAINSNLPTLSDAPAAPASEDTEVTTPQPASS